MVDAGLVRRHVSRCFASAVFGPRSRCFGTKPGLSIPAPKAPTIQNSCPSVKASPPHEF